MRQHNCPLTAFFHVATMLMQGCCSRRRENQSGRWRAGSQDSGSAWIGGTVTCEVCKTIVASLQRLVAEKRSMEDIIKFAIDICKAYKIESDRVCDLVVPQYSVSSGFVTSQLFLSLCLCPGHCLPVSVSGPITL